MKMSGLPTFPFPFLDRGVFLFPSALQGPIQLQLALSVRNSRSRAQTPIFTMENQHVLVQMAQAWPGPAQARPGARFWKSGDLEIQKVGIQKISKMKILKIQIRSAQNVGKVWISWKKTSRCQFGAIPGNCFHGPKKIKKNVLNLPISPWWANGPYSPGLGSCAGVIIHATLWQWAT